MYTRLGQESNLMLSQAVWSYSTYLCVFTHAYVRMLWTELRGNLHGNNSHGNSQGGLKTTLKGSMYRELPSELVTQIEKMPPVAARSC